MNNTARWLIPLALGVLLISFASSQESKKYSIKTTKEPVPQEVSEPIRKLLAGSSVQLLDPAGKAICDVWLRKDIPAEATPEQVKTGVTYREVKQTEILAAIQFHDDWTDYRKQKVKAGIYTLRLAYQPADGKHNAEFSQFQECALAISAKADTKADLMEPKALHEASADSIGSSGHPAIFMLWPNDKPGKAPELAARPKNHWVLFGKCNLVISGKVTEASMGVGITLVGHTPME